MTRYIPALRFDWLTRFYDPLVRVTLREDRFRSLLVAQADVRAGMSVLDVGCGTGTLALRLARAAPGARIVGIDGDAHVLALAEAKLRAAGVVVELRQALAWDLPFPAGSFDRVVSSLVFHHLTTSDKQRTLARIHDLLCAGGELHIADWGKPQNALMHAAFMFVRVFDGFETTRDAADGTLVGLIQEAGFTDVTETHHQMTLFGTLALYRATRRAA